MDVALATLTFQEGHEASIPAALVKETARVVKPPNCELRYSAKWVKPQGGVK